MVKLLNTNKIKKNPMILKAQHMLQHGSAAVVIKTQAAGEEKLIPPKYYST